MIQTEKLNLIQEVLNMIQDIEGSDSVHKSDFGKLLCATLVELDWSGDHWDLSQALPHFPEDFDLINLTSTLHNLGFGLSEVSLIKQPDGSMPSPILMLSPKKNENQGVLLSIENTPYVYDVKTNTLAPYKYKKYKNHTFFSVYPIKSDSYSDTNIITPKPNSTPGRWFFDILHRFDSSFIQCAIISAFLTILGIASSLFVMVMYDKVISIKATDSIKFLVSGMLIAIIADYSLRQTRQRIFSWIGTRLEVILAPTIIHQMLSLPSRLSESATIPAQLSRLRDFETVRDFFSGPIMMNLFEIPFILLLTLAVWFMAGKMAIIPFAVLLSYLVVFIIFFPIVSRQTEESGGISARRYNMIIDTIHKLPSILTSGEPKVWIDEFRLVSGAASMAGLRGAMQTSALETLSYVIFVIAGVSTLSYGILLVTENYISSGTLIGSMILVWRTISPLQSTISSMSMFIHIHRSIAQIHKLLLIKPEQARVIHTKSLDETATEISFSNAYMRHPNSHDPILNGFNATIKSGEVIALVGRNGSGKTTFLKLLADIYPLMNGSIQLNRINLQQYDPVDYRQSIGYVSESPELFFGTIAQNIRLGNNKLTDDDIINLLKQLGAYDAISKLPNTINYVIGDEKTMTLPSSLIYQITLARTLAKNPPLILMDEIPSTLTSGKNTKKVIHFINRWRGKKTILLVTFNEEVMASADRIFFLLGDGRIATGLPKDLIPAIQKQPGFKLETSDV